jgi:imidazolonepropionase-like amidohydrolase
MRAMADAGLTTAQVLAAGTSEAAAYFATLKNRGSALGIEPDFGVIAKGKRADLVVLREDPLASIDATRSIETVVVRGKVLARADLDRMLGQVEMSVRALP